MTKRMMDEYTDNRKWELDDLTLEDALHKIKQWIQQYGGKAKLDIGQEGEAYDYSNREYAYIRIVWKREETDEEYASRTAKESEQRTKQEAQERAQFEALKKKFGEPK